MVQVLKCVVLRNSDNPQIVSAVGRGVDEVGKMLGRLQAATIVHALRVIERLQQLDCKTALLQDPLDNVGRVEQPFRGLASVSNALVDFRWSKPSYRLRNA